MFLLGRVYVLVPVSKVAEFILSLELREDRASNRGSNEGDNSNRSSSIRNWSAATAGTVVTTAVYRAAWFQKLGQ